MATKVTGPTKADLSVAYRAELSESTSTWGVSSHDYTLIIGDGQGLRPSRYVVDVETDESEARNFVGLALVDLRAPTQEVHYIPEITERLREILSKSQFVGHNVKFDLHCMRGWGIKIDSSQIHGDTMLMAYSRSTTEESYGLKDLVKAHLGWTYPTYREIVGTGKGKLTLDQQNRELVANYCGMDALSAAELFRVFTKGQSRAERRYYQCLELPVYRALFDVEARGITIDCDYVRRLDGEFLQAKAGYLRDLQSAVGDPEFNPGSPKQVQEKLFKKVGIQAQETGVKILKAYENIPEIKALLKFREVSKLASTYTTAFLALPSLPLIHTRFNQVAVDSAADTTTGIRTGRLSSSEPNLQNIPTRTELGNKIRAAFIAPVGHKLIVADYSQIEYRLLAHFSEERRLIDAFKNGVDVHEATGLALGVDRKLGKTLNFAAIYGAQPKKIAFTAGITEDEAATFLARYWDNLPGVQQWIAYTRARARVRLGVETLYGRFISLPDLISKDMYARFHAERAAINYVIQGSAAEVMKLALLRLHALGLDVRLTVHDEFVVQVKDVSDRVELARLKVEQAMSNVVTLKVPLLVDAHVGQNWQEAKGGK